MQGDLWRSYAVKGEVLISPNEATMDTIINAYLAERLTNSGTIKSARTYFKVAREHLGTAQLCDLVAEPAIMVRYFRAAPLPPRWSPKTRYNYRLALRAALSYWIKSRNLTCSNPMNAVFLDPQTAIRENVPTPQDYARIIETANRIAPPYIAHLITAAWETGLRMQEYLNWRWGDIDLSFRDGLPWYSVQIRKQKRKVTRQIPMSQALWEMLSALPGRGRGPDAPVWPVRNPPYKLIRRVMREAGMQGLHLHDFRKSYKTYRKAEGWPKDVTKALQGHATDSMDSYYTVFNRDHLSRFVTGQWDKKILMQHKILIPPIDKRLAAL